MGLIWRSEERVQGTTRPVWPHIHYLQPTLAGLFAVQ